MASKIGRLPDGDFETSPERINLLFADLNADEQYALFDEFIGRVWDRYGGAGPPDLRREETSGGDEAPPESPSVEPPPEMPAAEAAPKAAPAPKPTRGLLLTNLAARHLSRRRTLPLMQHFTRSPGSGAGFLGRLLRSRTNGKEMPRDNVVNTGFSTVEKPDTPINGSLPLAAMSDYYFWLQVGQRISGAIDTEDIRIDPEKLPQKARLDVVLFAFENEFEVKSETIGQLELQADGSAIVTRTVVEPDNLVDMDLREQRLFFPVSTPSQPGVYRLRCNLYHKQVLVQSHLVPSTVGSG